MTETTSLAMHRAIFLDRDGVINEDPLGYVHKISDFKFVKGSVDGLKILTGYLFFIITNQSGIGRGIYSEEEFHAFNNHLVNELAKNKIKIEKTYFCGHHPDEKCTCRKPHITFIQQIQKEFGINLSESYVIGDHPSDIEMGIKAGCKTIYVLTGHGMKHLPDLAEQGISPTLIMDNLFDAAIWIKEND